MSLRVMLIKEPPSIWSSTYLIPPSRVILAAVNLALLAVAGGAGDLLSLLSVCIGRGWLFRAPLKVHSTHHVDCVLQELMSKYEAVNKAAWQAFGAIQALLSRETVLKDLTLNELQSLFRCEAWGSASCDTYQAAECCICGKHSDSHPGDGLQCGLTGKGVR